jgi:hypothetical protein
MSFIKKFFTGALVALLAITAIAGMVSTPALAQNNLLPSRQQLCPQGGCPVTGNSDFRGGRNGVVGFIINIAQLLTFVLGAVAVLFLVWGGAIFITSNGDEGKIKNARAIILNAVIGLVVAIVAYAVVQIVGGIVGDQGNALVTSGGN